MKKLSLIFAVLLIGVTSSFAQVQPVVVANWNTNYCSCSSVNAYFKVTISIYDNANNQMAIPDMVASTADATPRHLRFDAVGMIEYCHAQHHAKPSYTVTVSIQYIQVSPNPGFICCTGSISVPADCSNFVAGGEFQLPEITLQ